MKYTIEWVKEKWDCDDSIDYLFFWGHHAKSKNKVDKSCFSQWWPCEFTIDEVKYHSAEQYMMAEKAFLFQDDEIRKQILAAADPKQIKALGRKVKGFQEDIWQAHCCEIVKKGNWAKFQQNQELKSFLISTDHKILVEASPVDKIWGIGLAEASPDSRNPLLWRGTNLLGFVLMAVRDELVESIVT